MVIHGSTLTYAFDCASTVLQYSVGQPRCAPGGPLSVLSLGSVQREREAQER